MERLQLLHYKEVRELPYRIGKDDGLLTSEKARTAIKKLRSQTSKMFAVQLRFAELEKPEFISFPALGRYGQRSPLGQVFLQSRADIGSIL